jgi:hypothetical protein
MQMVIDPDVKAVAEFMQHRNPSVLETARKRRQGQTKYSWRQIHWSSDRLG